MQFCSDDSLELTPNVSHSFALRRNIRIKSSRLPPDFFNHLAAYRYVPSPLCDRPIAADISNRTTVRTPSFECKRRSIVGRSQQEDARKVETARPSLQKASNSQDLIRGVLSTSKNLRRAYRKPSLDFKESFSLDEAVEHFRLPKILNRGLIKQF